jgi:hypothetical protein
VEGFTGMASNFFARMYSMSRLPLYRVPLPAAQFLTVGRITGTSEERSFHPDNLHIAQDAPEAVVRVANKSAAFRKLVGAPAKAPKVTVTNMDAFGSKLKYKLGHGYAKVRAVAKVLVAANNAERNADAAAAAADAAELKHEHETESCMNDFVVLPESRYKFSDAEQHTAVLLSPTELRQLLSSFRGDTSDVSAEVMEKLKRHFKFDGSPADMQAFVAAFVQHKRAQAAEGLYSQEPSQPIEAMNRNARMPKAANHVSCMAVPCTVLYHCFISTALRSQSLSGKARREPMAPGQEEN